MTQTPMHMGTVGPSAFLAFARGAISRISEIPALPSKYTRAYMGYWELEICWCLADNVRIGVFSPVFLFLESKLLAS